MTDNTQADEYLQEQLIEQGDVSSMRYIGDDYTRIVTIREDRLLNIITAYTNKQVVSELKLILAAHEAQMIAQNARPDCKNCALAETIQELIDDKDANL